jgi:hypothetical protein
MNIELHIEEMILHGFTQADRHRIAEAVQDELVRLLAEKGLPEAFEQGIEFSNLDGGSFVVGSGESPKSLGVRIGQAVYSGMECRARGEE